MLETAWATVTFDGVRCVETRLPKRASVLLSARHSEALPQVMPHCVSGNLTEGRIAIRSNDRRLRHEKQKGLPRSESIQTGPEVSVVQRNMQGNADRICRYLCSTNEGQSAMQSPLSRGDLDFVRGWAAILLRRASAKYARQHNHCQVL